ncbi:MAG: DUF4279 domain-containing protein [Desulfovibrio sp.]|nr:DUF4279 domain-containing protein [Desulfovibrio sp.]
MTPACTAQLVVTGRFDLQEFTKRSGMSPTGVRRRGDFVKGTFSQHEQDQWIVSTAARRSGRCEDVLFDLFSLVSPHAQSLHFLIQLHGLQCTMRLGVMLEDGGPLPVLELSPEILRRVEALGATLAIHMQQSTAEPS